MKKSVKIMGVLNATPDSFSGDGTLDPFEIKQRAEQMIENGADIIDLGGESSGPGSKDVTLKEEAQRVIPALKAILPCKIPVSIDTYKAAVADEALENGASIINDVTGLRGDREMAATIAKHNAKTIIMYSKDKSARTTRDHKHYKDVMETIKNFFERQINYANKQGIPYENIIIDPGMGAFISAYHEYSFEILNRLCELKTFGLPILIGTSRKSIHPYPPEERLIPSIASALLGVFNGADIIRVHDVREHKMALTTIRCD